jgi:uncharacterized protein (TIGR01627 family)
MIGGEGREEGKTVDRSVGPLSSGVATLPLVSLVIINWNYAAYVGEAIDSLKAQDYPEIEIVVVDNGSTDLSRDVIAAHVAGDPQCSVIHVERNLGQLGAFFEILPSLNGDFVTILDADDALCPNFASTHVQVHLAAKNNAALTSSNLVEVDGKGRALTGHYEALNHAAPPSGLGLRRFDTSPLVPTISERDYHELARTVASYSSGGGWLWGPGSSTMYRRSVLELVRYSRPTRTWMRAADNFLNPLCHAVGGSVLINLPLSAYRVHGANYYNERESLAGAHNASAEAVRRSLEEGLETFDIFLERTAIYWPILRDRFWQVFDQLSSDFRGPTGHLNSAPEVLAVLSVRYRALVDVLGESTVQDEFRWRLTPADFYRVLRRAQGGAFPSLALLRHEESPVGAQIERSARVLRRYRQTPIKMAPRALVRDVKNNLRPSGQSLPLQPPVSPTEAAPTSTPAIGYGDRVGYGPCSVISVDPPVLLSGIAFTEYVGIAGAFGRRFGNRPAAFALYPTWTIASKEQAALVIAAARRHMGKYPDHLLLFMCNTGEERDRLVEGGLRAMLLNKNFLVSERNFRPLHNVEIEFDAIYNARFDPLKRHYLADEIEVLAYLSYDDPANTAESRQQQRKIFVDLMMRHPNHVLLNPMDDGLPIRLRPDDVNAALNRAAVGLCLSHMEGANYASMEYLLAGLPVVSTPSIGGREVYFDSDFCTICDPDPGAVRQAVESLRTRHIPRAYVRERTLAKIEPERRRFLDALDDLREAVGGKRQFDDAVWPFPNASELVLWNEHWKHLDAFGELSGWSPGQDREVGGTIADYPDESGQVQLRPEEIRPIVEAIRSRSSCSLLVFGCGNDSVFWETVNEGGTTVFLEDDPGWAEKIGSRLQQAQVHEVRYDTALEQWESLLHRPDLLELDLPPEIEAKRFDVILVDGPAGHDGHLELTGRDAPGRMQSIYMASKLVGPDGFVFVHDCDRVVEQRYATEYLGAERLFLRVEGRALLQGYEF